MWAALAGVVIIGLIFFVHIMLTLAKYWYIVIPIAVVAWLWVSVPLSTWRAIWADFRRGVSPWRPIGRAIRTGRKPWKREATQG